MKKLVIFDLDGTLLNTIDDLGHATNYALEKCGFKPHPMSAYPFMVGNGVKRLIERALPEEERIPERIEELRTHFVEYYGQHLTDFTEPYPGIKSLLIDLRSEGIQVAVASNKYQSAVEELIHHFFGDIDWAAIEGQRDDYPVKPDPSIVFRILGECPTPKAEVLYVGDSGVDMETARRACVDSVGVTWGFRPIKELQESHADTLVHNAEEILAIAKRPGL
ncbi:MAG: HAD family hydrolase [Bacteroidales bacterium]|nr:HAD family hydrolase [Bacteroidales bacterium]